MHFTAMGTFARSVGVPSSQPALIYRVELPFSSKIHLVGIPKKSDAVQLDPTSAGVMEKVDLEGNFGNYFSLYCGTGMQAETRYVLDPKAMAFVIDFCQSHNWEIVRNELYFLQAGMGSEADKTHMFEDIGRFVDEIRPALEKPLSEAEQRAITPYGVDRRQDLRCPLCHEVMANTGDYFACPRSHGLLVTGKLLPKVVKQLAWGQTVGGPGAERPKPLTCPACGSDMKHVSYNTGNLIIDACSNCPYRWLDAAEHTVVSKLQHY